VQKTTLTPDFDSPTIWGMETPGEELLIEDIFQKLLHVFAIQWTWTGDHSC